MQHDYSIANQGFPATRADINNALSAIATNNSGTSAPSTQYAGQFWIDTTSSTWTLYIHDGADDIQFATIDTSANTVNFIDSALDVVTDTTPQLGGNLDLNSNNITGTGNINITGTIESSGNITGTLATASQPNITSVGTLTSFASTGIDDNATSTAITIDSSQNVGIGTASPSRELSIGDGTGSPNIQLLSANNGNSRIEFGDTDDSDVGEIQYDHSSNFMRFFINGSESMRIDSSGRVMIGTTTEGYSSVDDLTIATTGHTGITIRSSSAHEGAIYFSDATSGTGEYAGYIQYIHGIDSLILASNALERMRILSGGEVLIGKTSNSFSTAGSVFPQNGKGAFVVDADECINCNRLTNDGNLIRFFQDGTEEGNISVSGATVAYNGFTGTHWSRFTDNSTPNILRGTILESLDEMCDWYNLHFETTTTTQDSDGNDVTNTENHVVPHVLQEGQSDGDVINYNHEGTDYQATIVKEADIKHVKSKVSDTIDAKNVYGVFMAYDEDGEGYNDFYVASVGSFVVRIKQGETVAKGDLLQSNGDGTAKVQADDALRSSSFAKVLSTTIIETYEDGSYLVPCSLMC